MIKKLKDNLLHINNFRKFVGHKLFGLAVASKFKMEFLDEPKKGRVLVIAPHPDDDVIGCGGAIAAHVKQGDKVRIVYLSNGGTNREKEARAATEELGASDLVFLGTKDNKIAATSSTVKFLEDQIINFKPDLIYAPTCIDQNVDHFEATRTLTKALSRVKYSGEIYSYEIWTPIHANRLLKIDNVFNQKIAAINKHESQLKDRPYVDAVQGLATYRASMFGHGKYAEAFLATNKELYIELFDLVSFKK